MKCDEENKKRNLPSATKVSIRFFDDREVRAVWDEGRSQWYFSVLDIVGVLNGQNDYAKNRNYWKYLKSKLKKENPQLVSTTTQLKLAVADGKGKTKTYALLQNALTDNIHNREMFMEGIDDSYYYEENGAIEYEI